MATLKDMRLKAFVKEETKKALLKCGRNLVEKDGIEALSARKLAKAANSSVGVIYNIFATMDDYVAPLLLSIPLTSPTGIWIGI